MINVNYEWYLQDDRDKIAALIGETLKDCSHSSPNILFQPLSHLPPPQQALMNTALSLAAVNSTATQVPMHSTS